MAEPTAYRVRWTEDGTEQVATAFADDAAGTVQVETADGQKLTVRATDGRAVNMLLTHLVYPVLDPDNVELTVEYRSRGGRWCVLKRWP